MEREEKERKNLQKMISEGNVSKNKHDEKQEEEEDGPPKVLRITRTFRNEKGKEYVRTELVRKPIVVQTYTRIRQTKDAEFIKQFATLDEAAKEEMKKEKRRIQEQLRRIKRNQEKEKQKREEAEAKHLAKIAKLEAKGKNVDHLKVKCGACGALGHMKTNRACPKFNPNDPENQAINVALTEKDMEDHLMDLEHADGEELVNVDGTKVTLSSKVLRHAEEVRRRSMILKVPKQSLKDKNALKRRRAGTVEHCDYLSKPTKNIKRRRTDPVVTFATFLEEVHTELRNMDSQQWFWKPVDTKKVVGYLDKIKNPMDLQTIKDILKKKYHSRQDFLGDINQIVENSAIFNGEVDVFTQKAKSILEAVIKKFEENEDSLQKLEKAINPLLDDNDQVAFSFMLESILNHNIKPLQESWPFQKPVNKKQLKHYYEKIKEPMDLETMGKKVQQHAYHSRSEFFRDMELIWSNSKDFNGEQSEFTSKAKLLVDITKEKMYQAYNDDMARLEELIQESQQRAIEQADVDSLGTSLGELDDSSRMSMPSSETPTMPKGKSKKKKGRPNRKAKMNKSYNNLMDDLQYSSDEDRFDDYNDDDDEEEEDEDWQEVDNEDAEDAGFTVTVDAANAGGWQVPTEDGGFVQIEAPNLIIQQPEEEMVEMEVGEDLHVAEEYDPMAFFAGPADLNQDHQEPDPNVGQAVDSSIIDVTDAINAAVNQHVNDVGVDNAGAINVIDDDLHISDDSDDEQPQEQPIVQPQQPRQPPPPTPRRDADDGIWF